MWHTLAFYKADTAGATNEQIPAVIDQIITQSTNGNYILQQNMRIMAAYFRDAGATDARINTPDYRTLSIPHVNPVQRQAGVTNLPAFQRFFPAGLTIDRIDEVVFQGSNNGAGGVAAVGGLWISPLGETLNIPQGDAYKLHATATTAGSAHAWELVSMTLDEVLPSGIYTVIGLDVVQSGATGAVEFARLAWTGGAIAGGGPNWRPGVLVRHGYAEQSWPTWQQGNFGVMGSFVSTSQPNLEVFSVPGTGVTLNIFLDVIKTG